MHSLTINHEANKALVRFCKYFDVMLPKSSLDFYCIELMALWHLQRFISGQENNRSCLEIMLIDQIFKMNTNTFMGRTCPEFCMATDDITAQFHILREMFFIMLYHQPIWYLKLYMYNKPYKQIQRLYLH